MDEVVVTARHDLSPDQVNDLEERLDAFNSVTTGYQDGEQISFLAHVGETVVGGVVGYTWGGVCELQQVWLDPDRRGHGLGAALMSRAIDEARRRGCASIFLTTYDFQAPGFYGKLGFEAVAELKDKPLGHTEFVMRLALG